MIDSTITDVIPPPRRRETPRWRIIRRWAEAAGRSRRFDAFLDRFISETNAVTDRAELHALIVQRVLEWTGAARIELNPRGAPRRVGLAAGEAVAGSPDIVLPIRHNGEEVGILSVQFARPTDRKLDDLDRDHLKSLLAIAALHDRLLSLQRELRLSTAIGQSEGVLARPILMPFLRQSTRLAHRRREMLTVLAIGLDRESGVFKILGDGQLAGLIKVAGKAVRGRLRESDLVVQYEHGILVALLPNTSSKDVPVVAEAILGAVAADEDSSAYPVETTVSIGAATFPDDAKEPDLLLDIALESLRKARAAGRGHVSIADGVPFPASRDYSEASNFP